MIIPLFGFQNGAVLGLNGISQALALQQQQQELAALVRNDARDSLQFQSELDAIQQFANARAEGLTPDQAFFQSARNAVNPLVSQAGLNNFVNQTSQLAPFALDAARAGNPGLINSIGRSTGFQFDPSNPTSGFGLLGAPGIGAQTSFNIRNNAAGGALSNPVAPTVAPQAAAPAPAPQQSAGVVTAGVPLQQPAVGVPTVATPRQQTQIQANTDLIRTIAQATQPQNSLGVFANTSNRNGVRTQTNPQTQPLPTVAQPQVSSSRSSGFRDFNASSRGGFRTLFDF